MSPAVTWRGAWSSKLCSGRTVHANNLLLNDGHKRQAVEAVSELFPELNTVPLLALVVKAVDTVDRGALVVAPQHEKVLWIPNLVAQKQNDHLDTLLATIDVVAEEKVVRLRRVAAELEKPQQVGELPVGRAGRAGSGAAGGVGYFRAGEGSQPDQFIAGTVCVRTRGCPQES